MEKKKMLKVVSSAMALTMLLAGCSSASNNKANKGTKAAVEFKTAVDNGGNALSGQQLRIGIASADPLTGMFNPVFALQANDNDVMKYTMNGAFPLDSANRLKQDDKGAPVMFHVDREKKEVTLTIHKDLKWSNGEDVKADDIVATYELMGNPKYTENVRYTDE